MTAMTRACLNCCLLLASLLLALMPAHAASDLPDLRAWNTHPDGYPVTEAMLSFADAVQKATESRVRIKVFSNAVLGDQGKAVQMMKVGDLDLAEFNIGPLAEAVPAVKVLTRPFLFTDSKHMFRVLDGKLGPQLESKLKQAGFIVLGWYDGGARSFYCTNKSIRAVPDLQGERIRVQQSESAISMVKLLGATPIVLPYKDVLDALKDGKVDCAENNLVAYETTGHAKVAKYVYQTNHTVAPEALVMSVKAWNRLSQSDQQRVQEAGRASALRMRELWSQRVEVARAAAIKQGSQFVSARDQGSIVKRLAPMFTAYLSDPESRAEVFTILAN